MKRQRLGIAVVVVALAGVSVGPTEAVVAPHAVASQSLSDIAYLRIGPTNETETIWSMNFDGSNQTQLSGLGDEAPAYSPNGRKIAFSSTRDTPEGWQGERLHFMELYVMNADGTNPKRLTFNEGLVDWQPTWSPDGKKIAFARGPAHEQIPGTLTDPTDLWIINLVNGKERQLTSTPERWEGFADWSPDGQRIAFEGNPLEDGNFDLYTIGVNDGGLRRLTTAPGWDGDPDYSPDGSRIAFAKYTVEGGDIYTIGVDGSGQQQLTSDQGHNAIPVFSPDGRYIAFVGIRDGDDLPDIFVMLADGTQQTNLTMTPGVLESDPDWSPR